MNIAITGANGFIGSYLCNHYLNTDHRVLAITRRHWEAPGAHHCIIPESSDVQAWMTQLDGTDVLIHLAGIAHNRQSQESDYYKVNLEQTLSIAKAAAACKVQQFIFLSSIKVNGEFTDATPFSTKQRPNPVGPYARSKWMAEQALMELAASTPMQITIIRPPLVFGDKPKGNLKLMLAVLKCGIPLPLKNINNKRDLISLANLASLLDHCLLNPSCYGKTLLASDGNALSTSQIIDRLARENGIKPRLISCPQFMQSLMSRLPGISGVYEKLFGNLEVDIEETRSLTGWDPTAGSVK